MAINIQTDNIPAVFHPLISMSVIHFIIYVLGFIIDQVKIQNIASEIIENNLLNENTDNIIVNHEFSNEKNRWLDSSKIKVKYSNLFLNAAVLKMVVWFVFDLYKSDFDSRELDDYQ